jgi:hypothetical protein
MAAALRPSSILLVKKIEDLPVRPKSSVANAPVKAPPVISRRGLSASDASPMGIDASNSAVNDTALRTPTKATLLRAPPLSSTAR